MTKLYSEVNGPVLAGFPKFWCVDFLVLGVCGHFPTVSSVGAGAGGAGDWTDTKVYFRS